MFAIFGGVILLDFAAALLLASLGDDSVFRGRYPRRAGPAVPIAVLFCLFRMIPKRFWKRVVLNVGSPVAIATLTIGLLTAVLLRAEGRIWWCAHRDLTPWSSDAWGPHNSQHLFDPYTLTHVLHGVVFWGALVFVAPALTTPWRFALGLGIEAAWEVLENTPWAIERYRTATAAAGYTGDSVLNALGDVAACGLGLALAARLGWRWSAAIFVVTELVLLAWIRDGLVLNVLMLLHPVESIRQWQTPK
jgi:hypothetical protein